jgi:hypothetical protein
LAKDLSGRSQNIGMETGRKWIVGQNIGEILIIYWIATIVNNLIV